MLVSSLISCNHSITRLISFTKNGSNQRSILSVYRPLTREYTAKKKCRKFEANIPRKGISGPKSQFPHSCLCERIIYSHDGASFLLEEICGPILGIYKSLTDT